MKKADIFILLGALVLAGVLFLVFARGGGETGALTAEVYLAGRLVERVPLDGPVTERRIETGDGGWNLLRVEPAGVCVAEANCGNLTCVHTGRISVPGGVIACLPHRVLIKLTGRAEGEVDVVVG
ncbi:MAG: NusG domain II-containing protein [Oscillospiraceae bacterium]|jgi:hypothetical protein|nr:NusG domain II-containing protein [Oscillospiraceae bacterium]